LQIQALSLYRQAWRAARSKPAEEQPALKQYIRDEFHKHRDIPRANMMLVEHMLRAGKKKLQMLSMREVTGVHRK